MATRRGEIMLPPQAAPHLARLRRALGGGQTGDSPAPELTEAFTAACGLVATVMPPAPDGRPDTTSLRSLAAAVPEFDAFLNLAAGQAGRAVHSGVIDLWARLGLRSPPPVWSDPEFQAARMAFACACAPAQDPDPSRIRHGLRALAAGRIARQIAAGLADQEAAWEAGLGPAYGSVRHRCAPRTAWRSRGLSDLVREDERVRLALEARLERWLAAGGEPATLAGELEAALVHIRTPPKFA
jgi:hypothetical protein